MKIKELHLRNIASIEAADIDFTEDLRDAVTGAPASVFLISGDTGAGKSVILDGISMALYKTTPRLSGVSNINNNEFSDKSGESIRVNSIEQYTRLGTSEKDECYSELVFDGNDGKEYRAMLVLGMYLTNRDRDGKRRLEHHKPVWKVKAGAEDWVDKDKTVEKIILDAIGLSFEQFGRMAMLAQGQFASFLTGDKKEREAILEQLTNTEHFSAYGAAIKSLFDKAKAAVSTAQASYDSEKGHTLSPEELEQLGTRANEAEAQKSGIEARKSANQHTMDLVKRLVEARNARSNAEERKVHTESALRSGFMQLTSDLVARRENVRVIGSNIGVMQAWLHARENMDALYSNAAVMDVRLGNYIDDKAKLAANGKQSGDEADRTEELRKNHAEAAEAARKAREIALAKQAEIDALASKRQQLKPEQVNSDLVAGMDRKALLEHIRTAVGNIAHARKEADERRAKLEGDHAALEQLRKDAEAAQGLYNSAKRVDDEASNALATMRMSLDDKIIELRRKLAAEHSETCPLCGQKIAELHVDEDFTGMLSPLEEMQKKTRKALEDAEAKRDKASRAFSSADGALKAGKKSYEDALMAIRLAVGNMTADAAKAGLDASKDVESQIEEAISAQSKRIEALEARQKEAEQLQKAIDNLLTQKMSLDKAKSEAEKKENEALAALNRNIELIENLKIARDELLAKIARLVEEISAAMGTSYPAWKEDTALVRESLKADSREYVKVKQGLESARVELERANAVIDNIEEHIKTIREIHPDWELSNEAHLSESMNIIGEWNKLSGSVQRVVAEIEGYDKTIAECSGALKAYYEAQGKSEDVPGVDALKALETLESERAQLEKELEAVQSTLGAIKDRLDADSKNVDKLKAAEVGLTKAKEVYAKWDKLNALFGGTRLRTLVQTYILRPLLNNANIYLERITDRYTLTCSEDNEQLSILVLDRYNKDQVRSATVLSGGERFMISLALSLALSSLNRPDMNVDILFIDEGFGTLDEKSLDSVMQTLEKLQEITLESKRRVGIISHREELDERIPVQIRVIKKGEGRSKVEIKR